MMFMFSFMQLIYFEHLCNFISQFHEKGEAFLSNLFLQDFCSYRWETSVKTWFIYLLKQIRTLSKPLLGCILHLFTCFESMSRQGLQGPRRNPTLYMDGNIIGLLFVILLYLSDKNAILSLFMTTCGGYNRLQLMTFILSRKEESIAGENSDYKHCVRTIFKCQSYCEQYRFIWKRKLL